MAGKGTDGLDRLLDLFVRASPHRHTHWNPETGETFSVRGRKGAAEAVEAFEERLFEEEAWIEVPWLESDDAFAMMQAFASELAPGRGRAVLLAALQTDKPFRAFRAALASRPGLLRRFRAVELEEAAERLCQVAVGLGIELPYPELQERIAAIRAEVAASVPGRVAVASLRIGRTGGPG
ncbi:MAG: hypothetical protein H6747_02715 [Deltaproteobacteria bacterium]|nr:hypothetical protein [Deltaproteobacteria bacterium]